MLSCNGQCSRILSALFLSISFCTTCNTRINSLVNNCKMSFPHSAHHELHVILSVWFIFFYMEFTILFCFSFDFSPPFHSPLNFVLCSYGSFCHFTLKICLFMALKCILKVTHMKSVHFLSFQTLGVHLMQYWEVA